MTEFQQNFKGIYSVISIIMQNICKVMQALYTTTRAKLRTVNYTHMTLQVLTYFIFYIRLIFNLECKTTEKNC